MNSRQSKRRTEHGPVYYEQHPTTDHDCFHSVLGGEQLPPAVAQTLVAGREFALAALDVASLAVALVNERVAQRQPLLLCLLQQAQQELQQLARRAASQQIPAPFLPPYAKKVNLPRRTNKELHLLSRYMGLWPSIGRKKELQDLLRMARVDSKPTWMPWPEFREVRCLVAALRYLPEPHKSFVRVHCAGEYFERYKTDLDDAYGDHLNSYQIFMADMVADGMAEPSMDDWLHAITDADRQGPPHLPSCEIMGAMERDAHALLGPTWAMDFEGQVKGEFAAGELWWALDAVVNDVLPQLLKAQHAKPLGNVLAALGVPACSALQPGGGGPPACTVGKDVFAFTPGVNEFACLACKVARMHGKLQSQEQL